MSAFQDRLSAVLADIAEAGADLTRQAFADVRDGYQQILTAHATITPSQNDLPIAYETVVTETEPDTGGVPIYSYGPDTNDPIPGLD